MFGIKCKVNGKTFRGQDFERLYCSRCSYWIRDKIKIVHLASKETEITVICPSLILVETYRPKRNTHIDTSKLPNIGHPYALTYRVSDDLLTDEERTRRYRVPEPC